MKKIIWKVIRTLISLVSMITSGYFIKVMTDLDMIPSKYYWTIVIVLVVLNILGNLGLFGKKLFSKIIGVVIFLITIVLTSIGINYGSDTLNFLNKAFNNNGLEVTGYNVVVLKSSEYEKIEDLNNKTMGYITIDSQKEKYTAIIKSKVSVEYVSYDEAYSLYEDLLNKKVDSLVLDEAYIDLLEDDYDDLKEKVKVIYSFEIEGEKKEESNSKKVTKLEPINILISGSDSRSGKIQARSRSDVNMIMTINPNTHTILLTSIPRDYYVQLHGTTGNKDKLTHAGIYGVNMSKETIEDLFGIKIDYTIKVGFQSVIKIVDLVGGIDINSDLAFTTDSGDGGVKKANIVKGNNHLNGGQALAYARERHAFRNGDVQRIQNQQQVLEAVINKISSSKTILTKYETFLNAFADLYRTDIPDSFIKLVIKEQLNDMKSWKVEKQYVTGSGASRQTYSMPGRNLYVMIPNTDSVNNASDKINDVLEGK